MQVISRVAERKAKPASPRLLIRMVAAGLWLGACTSDDSSRSTPEPFGRDSAGITIASADSSVWPAGSGWQVTPEPLVTIGVAAGAPEYELYSVWSATRLPAGNIVVGNAGTRELRTYDSDGGFVRSAGRTGSGPGEFQDISWVGLYHGDSIAVFDQAAARITVFDSESRVGRTVDLSGYGGRYAPRATKTTGEFLLFHSFIGIPGSTAPTWDSTLVIVASPDGRQADTLGSFPKALVELTANGRPEMLRPIAAIEGVRDGFLHWRSDQYELQEYDESGQLRRITRRAKPPEPVRGEYWEDFKAEYYRSSMGSGEITAGNREIAARRIQERLNEASPPESIPLVNAVHEDAEGNLWVREDPPYPINSGVQRWSVFDTARRWLGHVSLRSRVRVLQIGDDFVLGIVRDPDEVEQVVLYGLDKT